MYELMPNSRLIWKIFSKDLFMKYHYFQVQTQKELKNSDLPDELRIGAVLREKKVVIPRSNLEMVETD